MSGTQKIVMSPTLSQLLTTPSLGADVVKPKIDALSRDAVVQNATNAITGQSYDLLAVPHNATGDLAYSPDDNTIEVVSKKNKSKGKSKAKKAEAKAKAKAKAQSQCDKPINCPKCQECPDMSQYVRLDEVPCWNCTLP
jgi:hypothetical protein